MRVIVVVSHLIVGTVPLAEMESVAMPGALADVKSDCAQADAAHNTNIMRTEIGRFILFFI